jgi:hypothetical protein
MKQVITIVLIALTLISPTCKKVMKGTDPDQEKIIGKWQWLERSGGFVGKTTTPLKEGYAIRIEFDKNGIYHKYKNDSLVDRKQFSFSKQTSIRNQKDVSVISFIDDTLKFNESPLPVSISFQGNDTLMLNEEVHDGFEYVYVRIK